MSMDAYTSTPSVEDCAKWLIFIRAWCVVHGPANVHASVTNRQAFQLNRKRFVVPVPTYISNILCDALVFEDNQKPMRVFEDLLYDFSDVKRNREKELKRAHDHEESINRAANRSAKIAGALLKNMLEEFSSLQPQTNGVEYGRSMDSSVHASMDAVVHKYKFSVVRNDCEADTEMDEMLIDIDRTAREFTDTETLVTPGVALVASTLENDGGVVSMERRPGGRRLLRQLRLDDRLMRVCVRALGVVDRGLGDDVDEAASALAKVVATGYEWAWRTCDREACALTRDEVDWVIRYVGHCAVPQISDEMPVSAPQVDQTVYEEPEWARPRSVR